MKKLIAVSIILALFASFAVAQEEKIGEIGFSTWSQANFVPLAIYDHDDNSDTDNAWSFIGPYWGGKSVSPIRVNTTITGKTDFAGFQIDLSYDGAQEVQDFDPNATVAPNRSFATKTIRFFTDSDNVKLWVKPVSVLKLTYGKMKEDDLRGKVGDFSYFAPYGYVGLGDQDQIFERFEPNNGFHLALTPVEGLYIGSSVNLDGVSNSSISGASVPGGDDVWQDNIQTGLGYTIANIGLVRAQYIGRGLYTPSSSALGVKYNGRIEAAFAFTGMEGLTVDLGTKIFLWKDAGDTDPLFELALGAAFASGDFDIAALIDAQFAKDETDANSFKLYLKPGYNLGAFKVGADVGFSNVGSHNLAGKPKGAMDIGPWIEKSVAGGALQIGVMLAIPFGDYTGTGASGTKDGQLAFSIPVAATVSF
ncbi:MAG: hypothetical protein LBQ55_01725 [Treponema sp.]|jgi:hypothetical protein|nr:hypothetical protein [Treponema sp.]